MVLAALSGASGSALMHASARLRADKPFVLAAAASCGDPYSLVALYADSVVVHDHAFMAEVKDRRQM